MDNQITPEQLDQIAKENAQKSKEVQKFEFNKLELTVVLNTLAKQQYSLGVAEHILSFVRKIEPFVASETNIKEKVEIN